MAGALGEQVIDNRRPVLDEITLTVTKRGDRVLVR
jgi:hypothetical protein